MILIESIVHRFVDGPIATIIHHDESISDFEASNLPVGCTYTTETVVSETYVDATGRRFEIGMTEAVRDVLGLPLQSFQNQQAENWKLRALLRAYGRMTFRQRLRFLFLGGPTC